MTGRPHPQNPEPQPVFGAVIPLDQLGRIAAVRPDTICLIAPPSLSARLYARDLDAHESDRMQRLRSNRARDSFLVGHTLTRRLLAGWLGCDPAAVGITLGAAGKPLLTSGALHFNLSHSTNWIAVIISRSGPVGIDVESPATADADTSGNLSAGLPIEMVMHPADRFCPSPPDLTQRFHICWTLKEAIAKADGRGLNLGLAGIRLAPEGGGRYRGYADGATWRARHLRLGDGTHLAYAGATTLAPLHVMVG